MKRVIKVLNELARTIKELNGQIIMFETSLNRLGKLLEVEDESEQ